MCLQRRGNFGSCSVWVGQMNNLGEGFAWWNWWEVVGGNCFLGNFRKKIFPFQHTQYKHLVLTILSFRSRNDPGRSSATARNASESSNGLQVRFLFFDFQLRVLHCYNSCRISQNVVNQNKVQKCAKRFSKVFASSHSFQVYTI